MEKLALIVQLNWSPTKLLSLRWGVIKVRPELVIYLISACTSHNVIVRSEASFGKPFPLSFTYKFPKTEPLTGKGSMRPKPKFKLLTPVM